MTEIGKMIVEEALENGEAAGMKKGEEVGIRKGEQKGKIDTIIKILSKKFGNKVTEEYKSKLRGLSDDVIDIITVEIIDIKDISEIEKYF